MELLFAIVSPTFNGIVPSVEHFFGSTTNILQQKAIDPHLLSFLQHIHGSSIRTSIPIPYEGFLYYAHTILMALLIFHATTGCAAANAATSFEWCMKICIPTAKDVSLALSRLPTWINELPDLSEGGAKSVKQLRKYMSGNRNDSFDKKVQLPLVTVYQLSTASRSRSA
jgi:hypothetical protein